MPRLNGSLPRRAAGSAQLFDQLCTHKPEEPYMSQEFATLKKLSSVATKENPLNALLELLLLALSSGLRLTELGTISLKTRQQRADRLRLPRRKWQRLVKDPIIHFTHVTAVERRLKQRDFDGVEFVVGFELGEQDLHEASVLDRPVRGDVEGPEVTVQDAPVLRMRRSAALIRRLEADGAVGDSRTAEADLSGDISKITAAVHIRASMKFHLRLEAVGRALETEQKTAIE
ncbi:hypothetical protein EYF80_029460 [Liparis tanakae]|uniref:Uncharacterized protein n=1 Tax=Liparis tanakae TaxID=230148 RepID=A0A4Z2H4T1_9TELE|nr:hypothetical protein EYF80_029460 [Liparis tanakae]